MATIEIAHDQLHVDLKWYEKVFAWRGTLSVPLLHIASVEVGAEIPEAVGVGGHFHGTYVPGSRLEGTKDHADGSHSFFDVRDPKKALTIHLKHDEYKKVVVEVDDQDPQAVADRIRKAVEAARKEAGKA